MYSIRRDKKLIGTYEYFIDAWLDAFLAKCYSIITSYDGEIWIINPPNTN
jgi:hypothetical protein